MNSSWNDTQQEKTAVTVLSPLLKTRTGLHVPVVLREKGGRKAGGQPGHDGNTLKMTANPDEIVEHRACFCSECGKDVSSQPFELFGKKHWFWTWQNNRATYIAASDNRDTTTINENINGISNEAVLVHDCWKAHFQTPVGNHQLYTAHLERETKYLEERYKADFRHSRHSKLQALISYLVYNYHEPEAFAKACPVLSIKLCSVKQLSYFFNL